jgi:AraC-like DNA-binding protein
MRTAEAGKHKFLITRYAPSPELAPFIQRYRLYEAAMQMEKGLIPDWAQLSVGLGYYDQAHFIKDFKAVLGRSLEEYIRAMEAGGVSHHE